MRLKEVRNILYAHKKFLVSVNKAEEDGVLHTQFSSIPVKTGEMILTDQVGNSFLLTESSFNENYIPVEKVKQHRVRQLSPFEEQERKQIYESMAKGYQEMGDINLEEANASVHTYNDGLDELEKDSKTLSLINKIY